MKHLAFCNNCIFLRACHKPFKLSHIMPSVYKASSLEIFTCMYGIFCCMVQPFECLNIATLKVHRTYVHRITFV